jgi:hypothetical protein
MRKILVAGSLGAFVALQLAALPFVVPAAAQTASSIREGDYYAPGATVVQQPSQQGLNEAKEGDYYAPDKTTVQQPTPGQIDRLRQGDYYFPEDK